MPGPAEVPAGPVREPAPVLRAVMLAMRLVAAVVTLAMRLVAAVVAAVTVGIVAGAAVEVGEPAHCEVTQRDSSAGLKIRRGSDSSRFYGFLKHTVEDLGEVSLTVWLAQQASGRRI